MKTETKKAIEFCGNVMYQEDVCDCEEDDLLYNEEMRKVIALLQQGEKYKQMWEELKKARFDDLNDGYILDSINTDTEINVVEVLREMDMLEQRYFPKELQDEKTTKL